MRSFLARASARTSLWALLGAFAVLPSLPSAAQQTRRPSNAGADPRAKSARPSASGAATTKKRVPHASSPAGDPRQEQAEQAAERDRLNARIADLKKQIAAGEKSRSGAANALARAEHALVDVTRRLDELARRQRAARDLVASLDRQRAGTEGQLVAGQAEVDRTMTRLYANSDRDPLKIYLSGGNPNEARLTNAYLAYAARAQAAELDVLHSHVVAIETQRQRADEDDRLLTQQADAQKSAREALANDQATQRQALARLSEKLAEQRDTASALENDEKRLGRVIEQLQRVVRERERQAVEERARREAARRLAERQAAANARGKRHAAGDAAPKSPRDEPPADVEALPDEATGNGAFAQLRGQLRLPVRGSIVGRFGAPRGGGGATWKGVFVKTDSGAEVRAVAAGRVIFADDLRGFGNLLIVDHGNQYLSIYGNNEILLRHTGDTVKSGDVLSRAGNSSGDDQTGLYFELRFQGRPFDPMTWIGGR